MSRIFRDAMQLMRRHDPQRREDGFHMLLPVVSEHVDELLEAFRAERDDRGLRCWLLALIGEARSDKALTVLADQLQASDESLRSLAEHGLRLLDSKEARRLLWARSQNSSELKSGARERSQNSLSNGAMTDS